MLADRDGADLVGERAVGARLNRRQRLGAARPGVVCARRGCQRDTEGGVHPVLDLIDATLEAFFRATVPLSAQDVDVSFEPPDRDWSAKLTRPTVNLFLWDIRRSSERARAGIEEIERDGQLVRRRAAPARRAAVPRHGLDVRPRRRAGPAVRADALDAGPRRDPRARSSPTGCGDLPRSQLLMARAGDEQPDRRRRARRPAQAGHRHDGRRRGRHRRVHAGRPTGRGVRACAVGHATAASATAFAVRRVAGEIADPAAVGVAVISPRGAATVNAAGRFVIPAVAGDELVIETDPPRDGRRPARGRRAGELTCGPSCAPPTSRSSPGTSRSSRSRSPTPPT